MPKISNRYPAAYGNYILISKKDVGQHKCLQDYSENISGESRLLRGGGRTRILSFIGGVCPDCANLLREERDFRNKWILITCRKRP